MSTVHLSEQQLVISGLAHPFTFQNMLANYNERMSPQAMQGTLHLLH
jgi:hypothetical protein